MHAIEAQKEIISLMCEIDDTSPLPSKEGHVLVAINVLADAITDPAEGDDRPREVASSNDVGDSFISVEEAKRWLVYVAETLPNQVAMIGNFGDPGRLK